MACLKCQRATERGVALFLSQIILLVPGRRPQAGDLVVNVPPVALIHRKIIGRRGPESSWSQGQLSEQLQFFPSHPLFKASDAGVPFGAVI